LNQTSFINAYAAAQGVLAITHPRSFDNGELNKTLNATEKFQINQALERRGGLRFNYAPTNDNSNTKVVWIPFFENPMIHESRKANYASTKIFLRNEPVRLYTGSEARKFKVDIHYSLIHMAAMLAPKDVTEIFSLNSGNSDTYDDAVAIARYLRDTLERDTGSDPGGKTDSMLVKEAKERGNSADGPWGPNRWWQADAGTPPNVRLGSNYWNFALMWMMKTTPAWVNHHQIINKVINNVRSSVISTAQLPVKGPPIVELKWGTMYNFTPCIVTNYKIQPIENAGYDAKSLTAQRLKISFSLEEMRNINGNLWGDPKVGGDLPGWDSIHNLGSIDPPFRDTPPRSDYNPFTDQTMDI